MDGLSANSGAPKPFEHPSYDNAWAPQIGKLCNDHLLSPNYGLSDDDSMPERRSTKRTKKSKKKHSKSSKRKREHRIQGYFLQVIGLLCFILAAVKSFEPLAGIGLTLVLIGYNKNVKKDSRIELSSEKNRKRYKRMNSKHQEKEFAFALQRWELDKPAGSEEEMD